MELTLILPKKVLHLELVAPKPRRKKVTPLHQTKLPLRWKKPAAIKLPPYIRIIK